MPFQRMIRGSGAVCTLQLSGLLKREGRWFRSVVGPLGDPDTYRDIASWARALVPALVLLVAGLALLAAITWTRCPTTKSE